MYGGVILVFYSFKIYTNDLVTLIKNFFILQKACINNYLYKTIDRLGQWIKHFITEILLVF